MNWFDYLLIALLAVFVVDGLRRGLTRQVIGLAALLVGILLGLWTYGAAASFLLPYVSAPSVAKLVGFLVVFVGVQVLGGIAAWAVAKFFEKAGLGGLDRLLGGLFGALKAAVVGVILVMVMTAFPVKPIPESISGSRFSPYLLAGAEIVTYLAPRDLRDGFVATYERLREFWIQHSPATGKKLPTSQV